MYIHLTDNWPRFTWDRDLVGAKLAKRDVKFLVENGWRA